MRTLLWGLALTGSLLLAPEAAMAANSVTLTFNYTVVQGTCSVDVRDSGGASKSTIELGDITVPGTITNWMGMSAGGATHTPFSIALSNCAGTASASTTPGLTITGAHDAAGVTGSQQEKDFVFRDSGGTAKGFGFVIYKDGSGGGAQAEVADINSSQGGRRYIPIPGYGKGTALNGDVNVPLSVAVTCGVSCSSQDKLAGSLSATVTFNFLYY